MGYPHGTIPGFEGCGLPSALEAMGEKWSFLILRGALNGMKHFEEFQQGLGIARNILANRLARLVEKGIMDRRTMEEDRRKVCYTLTQRGEELVPVMVSLRQWGEKWGVGVPSNPVLCDRRDRKPIRPITLMSHDGRELGLHDLSWVYLDDLGQLDEDARAVAAE